MALDINSLPPPTTERPLVLSVSGMRTFQSCPRRFRYRYVDGIESKETQGYEAEFGTRLHAVLEHNHAKPVASWSVREALTGVDADLGSLVAGTAAAYGIYWEGSLAYTHKEYPLRAELRNPRAVLFAIVDGIARDARDELVVVDHKSSGRDISPGAWFWERLQVNQQASAYIWAARRNGFPVSHGIWDAVKRPGLKRRLQAIDPEYYSRSGKWGKAGDLKPGTGIPAESPADFATRVKGTILAAPADYFQRAPVVRLEAELEAAIENIEQVAGQILHAWDRNEWPQTDGACGHSPQYRCPYWEICAGAAQPTDEHLYKLRPRKEQ